MVDSFVVIGGEGFVGHSIVAELAKRFPDTSVSSFDIEQRFFPEKNEWQFYNADLTNFDQLKSTLEKVGPTTIFHTASPHPHAPADISEKINVQGTQTIIDAAIAAGVKKLIYTSSSSVIFDGSDLINVDERLSYSDVSSMGPYNVTKQKGEKLVIESNGRDGLLTCAVRPAGIFGPGDRQAIPGMLGALKNGQTKFQLGDNSNLVDYTYIDNVVHGHILAAQKLGQSVDRSTFTYKLEPVHATVGPRDIPTSISRPEGTYWIEGEKELGGYEPQEGDDPSLPPVHNRFYQFFGLNRPPIDPEARDDPKNLAAAALATALDPCAEKFDIAGQVFLITNGEPLTFWSFPRHLWKLSGHVSQSNIVLPAWAAMYFARLAVFFCSLTGKESSFTPTTCRYTCSRRYFEIEKSRRLLGYEPIVGVEEGLKRSHEWAKSTGLC